MKLPVPSLPSLLQKHHKRIGQILALGLGAEVKGVYEHWDHRGTSRLRAARRGRVVARH